MFEKYYQKIRKTGGTDMFEKYYQNVGGVPEDKEKLLTEFSNFLDDPMTYGGFFVVRCIEDDDEMINTVSLKDFVKTLE